MKRAHVLAFTSLFRTPHERVRAPFTGEFLRALQEFAAVSLVCPIPWAPDVEWVRRRPEWSRFLEVPAHARVDGVDVHYVRYAMLPKVSGSIQAVMEAWAAYPAVRRIHQQRPVDVINGRFIYPDGVAASIVGARLGIPVVLTALGTDIDVYSRERFKEPQIRWALNRAAHVTAVSPSLADRILELGTAPSKVSSSVNGIDLERFRPDGRSLLRERCGLDPERKVLVTLARLSSEKGLVFLLDALGRLAASGRCDFHTVIIGDGPERRELEEQAARLGLNAALTFAGEIDHSEVPSWLRGADAFCLPSLREGTPNVVIEALATGVPVVATRVGGTPLLIGDHNGRLVPPGQADPLAQAIADVISRQWDPASIRRSVAHMSWRAEARRHAELALSMCKGGTPPIADDSRQRQS